MITLEDLKKRATASEAVLIERVEALVAERQKGEMKKQLLVAVRSSQFPDVHYAGSRDEHPAMDWVKTVIQKIEKTEL